MTRRRPPPSGAGGPPVAAPEDRDRCALVVDRWAAAQLAAGSPIVAVDHDPEGCRWYLRMAGTEKEFVTVWLTLGQRTLRHEAQVMPAPETNAGETFQYLLRRSADLRGMRFSLGPEDAVYLVGEVAVAAVDEEELDRILGGSLAYVDDVFPTAMAIGFAGRYRRRPAARR